MSKIDQIIEYMDRHHFRSLKNMLKEYPEHRVNLEKIIEGGVSELENKDPWCYDMDKAPKDNSIFTALVSCVDIKTNDVTIENVNMSWCDIFHDYRIVECDSLWENYYNDKAFLGKMQAWMPIPELRKDTV